jgi:hypothetical protein
MLDREEQQVHRILVIQSRSGPSSRPYVSHFDTRSGDYFYIAGDDYISQDSFVLLNLLLTIQAAPAPTPLTPTVSVGGAKTGSGGPLSLVASKSTTQIELSVLILKRLLLPPVSIGSQCAQPSFDRSFPFEIGRI